MNSGYLIPSVKTKIRGYSLIELMVSMVLGLTIIGGLMGMYLGSRETDKTRTALSDIDANAVVALKSLRKIIQHTGYGTVSVEKLSKAFLTESDGTPDNPDCRDGKKLIISGVGVNSGLLNPPSELEGYTKDGTDGDAITVIYRPDSPFKGGIFYDCATSIGDPEKYPDTNPTNDADNYPNNYPYGTATSDKDEDNLRLAACSTDTTISSNTGMPDARDAKVYSGFFLRQPSGEPKQLVCYGSRSSDAEPHIIADNVDNMQIRYGVRTNGNTSYKNATSVESASEWEAVISVQIALLIGSDNDDLLENPAERTYDLLGETITKPATDKRLYKTYSTTIYLHNADM